ncbi:unnamed protein product [Rotaria sp. Silwood2]|nr:unnamed protein product [Rotaria sp. Silwood2]CAF4473294.1 unnamed protein product [Rotaria sp. Silwood2]
MGKKCFEKAIACGDVSGFSHIGLTFSIISLKENQDNIKKQSRKELKKALRLLESMKQNLMANLKIAEFLPQSATDDVIKKVSSKDNFYEDQIRGKLEVIGLQLHYLKKAVGETVEPYDFILHAKDDEKFTTENMKKGEELYNLLVKAKIIHGDRIRKTFKRNSEQMDKIIRDNLDPSIADPSINLLKSKDEFTKKDFEDIVCYKEQLWDVLNVQNVEDVFILNIEKVRRGLPNKYENAWKDLADNIDPSQVDVNIFEESSKKIKLKHYLVEQKLLVETKRIKIDKLDLNRLKLDGNYEKYGKIRFNCNGDENGTLEMFLEELKVQIIENGGRYLYQQDLPFGTKEEEGNKIRIFLKEKYILKSGGFASREYKYGDQKDKISGILDETLKNTEYINDKESIQSKLAGLQGDIRAYEEGLKANLKDFIDLENEEIVPSELNFFRGFGLDKFLIIEEDKSWWDWRAFAVAMIGVAQVIGGAALVAFGCVNIGNALIAEGISDMIYATMAGLSGTFSWKDWAIQKSISFTISLATAGIATLASLGNVASKLGAISKSAIFVQLVKQAAYQFVTTCATNILTEKVMQEIQENVIKTVVNGIEEKLLKGVHKVIDEKVEKLYATCHTDRDFEEAFKNMETSVGMALGKSVILPEQFNNIRIQVASSLKRTYEQFGDTLLKSSSKYAKLAGATVKSVVLVDKIWSTIEPILKLASIITTFTNIIDNAVKLENVGNHRNINSTKIKDRAAQLKNMINAYITKTLTRELDKLVRQVVSTGVNQIAKGATYIVKTLVESEFNGKNPIDTLRKSNQNERDGQKSQIIEEQPSPKTDSRKDESDQKRRENLQNDITNPKEIISNYADEIKDKNRPLGLADIKMLADKKMRNIVVYDETTKKKHLISPPGWKKIPAFFKQSAKIIYAAGKGGDVGHFTNALAPESFKQVNGRKDCLLIAYKESLGYEANDEMIEKDREKLYQFTARYSNRYARIRSENDARGYNAMLGAGAPTKRNLFEKDEIRLEGDRKRDHSLNSDGTYRTKGHETSRIEEEFGVKISGKTHEYEHGVSYRASAADADPELEMSRDRGIGGRLERAGPAYVEVKQAHRDHISTNNTIAAAEFAKTVGVALKEDNSPSNALQMSLVEYAHTPSFVRSVGTQGNDIANDSYVHMIMSIDGIPVMEGKSIRLIPMDIPQKKECIVSRWIIVNQRYPTEHETKNIIESTFNKYGHKLKK